MSQVGSNLPPNILEMRAAEQRLRVHNSIAELRAAVAERTDVSRLAREHVWPAAGIAAGVGLILGYGVAGMFVP